MFSVTPGALFGLAAGDTARLRVSALQNRPLRDLRFVTSDPVRLRVDSTGLVTALAHGSAIIRVTASGEEFSVPITVLGLTLEPSGSAVAVGGSLALRAVPLAGAIADYGAIRWSSSDPRIATVDSLGVVRGVGGGVARIAAVASVNPRVRAERSVAVVDVSPPVLSISATPALVELAPGGTRQLAVNVVLSPAWPPGTSRQVNFASSDTAVASVNGDGLVTARRLGTATVTVSSVVAPNIATQVAVVVRGASVAGIHRP